MTGTQHRHPFRAGLMMSALVALGACGEGHFEMPAFASRAAGSPDEIAGGTTTAFVERDVEAPEVFQVTEAGLWDGRPSLGGIWVAHPDVSDPERVIIRNSDNGQFVIGALFRRERETPGPRLQVSSDAAEALGLLAGAPTQLNVTALRSETQPVEASAVPSTPAPQTGELEAPDSVEITALESTSASTLPATEPQVTPISAQPAPSIQPVQPTRTAASVDPIASAAAALEAIGAAVPAAAPAVSTPAIPAVAEIPAAAPVTAAAPIAAPPAPVPAAATTQTATPTRTPVTPAPSGDLSKPYIQIGIFSVEENAMSTANAMRSAGVTPIMLEGQSQGRRFWRVIVGPAGSEAERAQMLQTVKAEGFGDAYAVTN